MSQTSTLPPSLVRVERIALQGPGVVILTGPSSCGKGEVAHALCETLSINPERHLSMGGILRNTVERSKTDSTYASLLEDKYSLSNSVSMFDSIDTTDELSDKVRRYLSELQKHFGRDPQSDNADASQLEWLEFCTVRGLLIPNRWTQDLISAEIDTILNTPDSNSNNGFELPFILDGYPRTVAAAEHLLNYLRSVNVPVLKVLHLSISKAEMSARAGKRGRADDHEEALRSRFEFYVENVQPSVDYMKTELGGSAISLIDAHQPEFINDNGERVFQLQDSIDNVVSTSLRALGVPRVIVRDMMEARKAKRQ
ncbi:MAG: nucleoside monophosphate kinase [Pseudomonadota bacterium]